MRLSSIVLVIVLVAIAAASGCTSGVYWYALQHNSTHDEVLFSHRIDFFYDRLWATAWAVVAVVCIVWAVRLIVRAAERRRDD